MAKARIHQPAKTAMQSGRRKTHKWVLEFEPAAKSIDPLMGWTSSKDTRNQVHLAFPTKEAAVAFAEKNGIDFTVYEPQPHRIRPKSYAARFRSALSG